jgi:hypothetical protein
VMIPDELLRKLCALERELHVTGTRTDRSRLDELLHRDFWEIGRSGVIHTRSQILESLPADEKTGVVHAQEFGARMLAANVVLLTYKTADVSADGSAGGHALRSSIWMLESSEWQMLFHQGTPTAVFQLHTD